MSNWNKPSTVIATLLAGLIVGCGGPPTPNGPSAAPAATAASPAASAVTTPPSIADVPFYKADNARSGVQPGPAPMNTPVEAWRVEIDCGLGDRTGVVGSGLYVVGCDANRLIALDARSGSTRWSAELRGPSLGSPAIADGAVFVSDSAGYFTSFDLARGDERWSIRLDANRHPVVVGGTVYVGTHGGRFHGISPADGSITWTWQAPAGVGGAAGTVVDETAFVGTDDGRLHAISLADATERWSFRVISGNVSTPAITADTVFVAALQNGTEPSGELYALDRATGADRWRQRTASGNQIAPPTTSDGVVYTPSQVDGLFAFSASDGKALWQTPTGPMAGQPPAIVGSTIVLATDRSVVAFDRSTGRNLWEFDLEADIDGSPVVSGGLVFVGDNSGTVRALAEPALATLLSNPAPSPVPQASGAPVLELVATFDRASSELDQPSGMEVGPDGKLYVVNALASEILVLDADDGSIVRRWGDKGSDTGQFDFLRDASEPGSAIGGVGVSADGSVYVADTVNRRVQQFDSAGTFVRAWGRFGTRDGQFLDPFDLDIGPDGSVYVVDDQRDDIQRFRADGGFLQVIGEHGSGDGQMNFTGGISVGPDGTIYNADWSNFRIQAWDVDGSFLWTVGSRGAGLGKFQGEPGDIGVGDDGRIYVTSRAHVQVFDSDRSQIGMWPTESDAFGITTGNGMVFVSDQFQDRIFVLRPIG